MLVLSAFGIIICFVMLIVGTWKNVNTFLIAAFGAGLIGLTGGVGFVEAITGPYMDGFVNFTKSWILIFALGGLLGGLYSASGAAWRIGDVLVKRAGASVALLAYVLFGAGMVYAGITAPLTLFVLVPLAKVVFEKAQIPWYLFPGVTGFAIITFAMYAPGSLAVVNLIPTQLMGVSTTAAPIEGIVGALFLFIVGLIYLKMVIKKNGANFANETAEKYLPSADNANDSDMDQRAPSFIISLIPLALTLVLVNIVKLHLILSFSVGCITALILFWNSIPNKIKTVTKCFNDGLMPCILVSAVAGLGSVISLTPVFEVIKNSMMSLPVSGLSKVAIITTILSGVSASGGGGVQITLNMFANEFLSWGYSPEAIARIAAIACGGLDSLPWNGTVVALFGMCGVGFDKGYKHVFVLTVVLPIVASLLAAFTYGLIH